MTGGRSNESLLDNYGSVATRAPVVAGITIGTLVAASLVGCAALVAFPQLRGRLVAAMRGRTGRRRALVRRRGYEVHTASGSTQKISAGNGNTRPAYSAPGVVQAARGAYGVHSSGNANAAAALFNTSTGVAARAHLMSPSSPNTSGSASGRAMSTRSVAVNNALPRAVERARAAGSVVA
jgi:hypothetical protein